MSSSGLATQVYDTLLAWPRPAPATRRSSTRFLRRTHVSAGRGRLGRVMSLDASELTAPATCGVTGATSPMLDRPGRDRLGVSRPGT